MSSVGGMLLEAMLLTLVCKVACYFMMFVSHSCRTQERVILERVISENTRYRDNPLQ